MPSAATLPASTSERAASAYDRDVLAWATEQAQLLREGRLEGLDLEHLAEEIEDLARSIRRELRSRARTVIEYLVQLELSPARAPRRDWTDTVRRTRLEIEELLGETPSLRRELDDLLEAARDSAGRLAARSLAEAGEAEAAASARATAGRYGADHVLGSWLPGERR